MDIGFGYNFSTRLALGVFFEGSLLMTTSPGRNLPTTRGGGFAGGLRGLGQALVAGCVASVGVAGAGVAVGLLAWRPLGVATTWSLLIAGTGILIVAGLLLLGRMPAADRKQRPASPLANLKQAAREATSPERESVTDSGLRLFVVGATVLVWGFVASAVFRV